MYELVLNKDGTQGYWARKSVASDPSLMRENQVVESVRKIDDIIDANLVEPEEVSKPSIVNTLVHQYFIKGGKLGKSDVEKVSFQQMVDEF
jgi:hypothetical protein